jgi:hypothetical protein
VDVLTGGSGNDTFDALVNAADATKTTVGSGDVIAGGAGADTLSVLVVGAAAPATVGIGVRANAVETVQVTNLASGAVTVDTQLMPDLTSLSVVGGTNDVVFSNVTGLDALNVASSRDVTVTLAAPTGTGTADAASVTLNGAAQTRSQTVQYNGVEIMSIALAGVPTGSVAGGFTASVASTSLKSATITGSQSAVLAIATPGAVGTDTSTVDASATTGGVNLTVTPGTAAKAAVSGGSGADVIAINGTITDKYTVSGGAGTDVLSINASVGYDSVLGASQGDSVTGFETLRTTGTVSQDMRGLSKNTITALEVHGGNATLTQAPVISTLQIGAPNTGAGVNATITLATAANTTNDTIAVTLGNVSGNTPVAANAGGNVSLSLTNYENISVASIGANNGTVSLTAAALKALTVTGDKSVTVTAGSGSVAVSSMIASAHTGDNISVSAGSSAVATTVTLGSQLTGTVTTGSGADTITGSTGNDTITSNDGNDSITAGTGNDSVVSGLGNDIISAGAGNDTVLAGEGADSVDGGEGADTIEGDLGNDTLLGGNGNDTILGGSGDDNIDGGAGNDSLTAGTGSDTILGGDGNDTIIFGTSLTTGDSADGGAGTDTVSATISTSSTPIFVNIENLDFTGGLATAGVTTADPYGTAVNLASSSGATTARVQLTGTNSGGLIGAPSTMATVNVADADDGATLNLRWAASPTAATINVDTLATTGVVTAGANALTIRQATSTAYNDTAGTGRTYAGTMNSSVGTVSTDARTLTIDMPALTAATDTGSVNLTVGNITANSAETYTVSAGNYADATVGTFGSTNADFSAVRITAGELSNTVSGNITASSAARITSHYVESGTLGSVTVGTANYGAANPVTLVDLRAGAGGVSLTHGAITSGLVSTFNINVGVNGNIRFNEATANDGTNRITNQITASTITLNSGVTENFTFSNAGAQGDFTLTGGSTNASTVTFSAGTTLSSFSASGYSGTLTFNGAALTGAIGSLTGTNGIDNLTGGAGNDSISGGLGADVIVGGAGADTINGGAGDDAITGGTGADRMSGSTGVDTFNFGVADSVASTSNTLTAGGIAAGNTITFGSGVDYISDFAATDLLNVAAATAPTTLIGVATATALTAGTTYVVYGTWDATNGVFTIAAAFNATSAKDALVIVDGNGLTSVTTTGVVILDDLTAALAGGNFI